MVATTPTARPRRASHGTNVWRTTLAPAGTGTSWPAAARAASTGVPSTVVRHAGHHARSIHSHPAAGASTSTVSVPGSRADGGCSMAVAIVRSASISASCGRINEASPAGST